MHACIDYSPKTRFDTVIREFQSVHKVNQHFISSSRAKYSNYNRHSITNDLLNNKKKGANVIIELLVNELYDWMILTCIRLRCVQRLNQRLKWWFESRKEAFLWIFSDLFNRCCFSFFFARGGRFNGSNDREKTSTINEEKKEMKSNKRERERSDATN